MSALTLQIYDSDRGEFGPCECCGQLTTRVWGYVYRGSEAMATYFIEWTPGHPDRSASFDLIIGKWGEQTQASDRQAASLSFLIFQGAPSFMVVDAPSRKVSESPLISHALSRDEIIGTPLASDIFSICDAIYLDDPRIVELTATTFPQ